MASTKQAPQQYSQPSRKGKKAWRKNVDVSEVEQGLEIVRDEEIKGGVIAEKTSEQLFTLDTTGSEAIQRSVIKIHKPLKADQILAQRSAVPAVSSRIRAGVTDGVLEPSTKKRKTNGLKPEEYERLKRRAYGGESVPKDIVAQGESVTHDPWVVVAKIADERFTFLDEAQPIRAPKTLKDAPISLLENKKAMPAVPKPKAGVSYNPSFPEWSELLEKEGEKAVQVELQRQRDEQEEVEKQARMAALREEPVDWMTEDESAWEGFESEYETAEWLKKKRPERKTPAERNKVKRRKTAERLTKHLGAMKRRDEQAKHLERLIEEAKMTEGEKALALAQDSSASDDDEYDDSALRRRKLGGNMALPAKDLELALPDELVDSLRRLKPDGNLLKERFRNIIVRGKVEARRPIFQPKKARRKATEKWSYKDFTITA